MIAGPLAYPTVSPAVVAAAWEAIDRPRIEELVQAALHEDIGTGDVTSAACIPDGRLAAADFGAKEAGTVAGLGVARLAMELAGPEIAWRPRARDGQPVDPGDVLAHCRGDARIILAAERVALNFLQRMSGIATLTRQFVDRVAHTQARILDTRKTAPGLRLLDKYAVVCGGGHNHRFGLFDGVLIKDNHISAAGGIAEALAMARLVAPRDMEIEIEVDRIDQIEEALRGGAGMILLDNMSPRDLRQAVGLIGGRVLTEASGGVNPHTVAAIAETGVDFISVGGLTHSPRALDISLDFECAP